MVFLNEDEPDRLDSIGANRTVWIHTKTSEEVLEETELWYGDMIKVRCAATKVLFIIQNGQHRRVLRESVHEVFVSDTRDEALADVPDEE